MHTPGRSVGRVLVGLQIPTEHEAEWSACMTSLGFVHVVETDNVIYKQFLGNSSSSGAL